MRTTGSSTLHSSDFHLYLIEFLGGQRFNDKEKNKDFFDVGIQKLVERYNKYLNKNGNDVQN